jgi:acyl-homoserine-lactone acylase
MYDLGEISKKRLLIIVLTAVMVLGSICCGKGDPNKTEILWDTWGVPHIFGKDIQSVFYAFGWAQMQSHGDLILKLYGEARGRASEYWGESNLESDLFIRSMDVPERATQWFKAQSPQFQDYLQAFAKGMNDYAAKHKDKLDKDRRVVLPVTAVDVLAHTQRVIHLHFVGESPNQVIDNWKKTGPGGTTSPNGSNAWAIAPSHSASGKAMLLANPHLPWSDFFMFYEAQLTAPGLNNVYGVTLVGMPFPVIAFNDYLGWSHTVNVHDGADFYELTLKEDGYLLDGEKKKFETQMQTVKIKDSDGNMKEQKLVIAGSVFGPVVAKKESKALVLKIAGLDRPLIWEQWFEMAQATNLTQFEKALERLQIPMFNVIYADRDGHIMLLHNAVLPKRSTGDWGSWWRKIIPADQSDKLWNGYHPYSDLAKVVDPPNGWIQNANDPPWSCTYPMVLKPEDYVNYMSVPLEGYRQFAFYLFRPFRSLRMVWEDKKISFEELVKYKHSTRMELADRLLDDLLLAVQEHGNDLAKEAAKVLAAWDKNTEADSRGAVLFEAWISEIGNNPFAKQWEADAMLTTPDGLKDPKAAAAALEKAAVKIKEKYGALDIPWGDVYRFKYADKNLPANGGPGDLGILRTMYFDPDKDGIFHAVAGDTYITAVEFSDPVKAMVVLVYGNASQPNSPHRFDQIELAVEKKLRPVWRTKPEIEKHLEKIEVFE